MLSPQDELANTITHGAGFLLSLAVLPYLAVQAWPIGIGLTLSCVVFAIALASVYLLSTLSHAIREPRRRNRLRAWDQGTIYLLIIGTYTPFIWQGSDGVFRVLFLIVAWSAAAFGFSAKVFAKHRINSVATITYLALGWLPAIPLWNSTPTICFVWMLAGGLCYSAGVPLLKLSHRVTYSHAGWHIMVMAGSACHVYAIQILIGHA